MFKRKLLHKTICMPLWLGSKQGTELHLPLRFLFRFCRKKNIRSCPFTWTIYFSILSMVRVINTTEQAAHCASHTSAYLPYTVCRSLVLYSQCRLFPRTIMDDIRRYMWFVTRMALPLWMFVARAVTSSDAQGKFAFMSVYLSRCQHNYLNLFCWITLKP